MRQLKVIAEERLHAGHQTLPPTTLASRFPVYLNSPPTDPELEPPGEVRLVGYSESIPRSSSKCVPEAHQLKAMQHPEICD